MLFLLFFLFTVDGVSFGHGTLLRAKVVQIERNTKKNCFFFYFRNAAYLLGKTKSYGIILNSPINRTQNKSHTESTEGLARRPAGESQITEIIARRPVLAALPTPI